MLAKTEKRRKVLDEPTKYHKLVIINLLDILAISFSAFTGGVCLFFCLNFKWGPQKTCNVHTVGIRIKEII